MKILTSIFALALVVSLAAPMASAQFPPVNGTYTSTDLGGTMLVGRSSVSWISSPDGRQQPGNVAHAESWDGATLGTQWYLSCPILTTVQLLYDGVVGGTGQKSYLLTYSGGTVWLDGAGPWGGGDPSYTGIVTSYNETRTLQYVGGNLVGTVSNHAVQAKINGFTNSCVTFGIGNSAWVSDTDVGAKPATYPSFLDNTCAAAGTWGHWDDMVQLTLSVTGCVVPTAEKTWGEVKSLYQE